jgi:hypothetical protein
MRTSSAALAILLGMLPGAPLLGDDVYLKNGRSFENVVAEVGDAQVRVHMPGGVVSLPRSAVDRVEKSDSSFAEYSRRKQELESRARGPRPPGAADWLELARWARANNLPQAAREAALKAAEINPREAGLAGLLRGFGYVYEESLDRWIPYDDAMRLHGMVQEGGTWVSREEHAARLQQKLQEQAARAAAAAAARDEAAAAMLQAQAALAQQGAVDNGYGGGTTLGSFYGGFGAFGGYWPYGGASVFGVPGFGLGARRGFAERGFHEHRHGAGGPGNRARGMVFGVPRGQTSFRPPSGTARGMRAAGRR